MTEEEEKNKKAAYLKAASYCAYQERCETEVKAKLIDLGMRGSEVQELLNLLIEENFVNEERFAKTFASGKFRVKKWGKMKISQALMQKGVGNEYIHEALEDIDEDQYREVLYQLLMKKWKSLKAMDAFKRNGKLFNFAASKGFEPNYIWEVIREMEVDMAE